MELVYLWVEDYKNIHKQGFNFSPRFHCDYNEEQNELTIDENDNYIPNFFGNNINITAIVGKNGSGKSSVLESLHSLINNRENINFNYILVYRIDNINYTSNIGINTNIIKNDINQFECNIYSNDLKEYKNSIDISKESVLKNLISNSLQNDFELTTFMYIPTSIVIIRIHIYHKFYELLEFQIDDINYDKATKYKENKKLTDELIETLNYLKLSVETNYHRFLIILFISNKGYDELYDLKTIDKLKKKLKESDINYVEQEEFDRYFSIDNEPKPIEGLSERIKNFYLEYSDLFTFDFIDSKDRGYNSLSHGERTIFGQFLSIYYLSIKQYINNYLFLLDEAELSLHPNWQKQYINEIILLLKKIDKKFYIIFSSHSPFLLSDIPKQNIIFLDTYNKNDEKVINEKQKIANCKVVNGLNKKKQTFGANIHTLLSDSFFMEDGLMGEFAKSKINNIKKLYQLIQNENVQERLKEETTKELAQKSFNRRKKRLWLIQKIIGEPFLQTVIKNYLDEIENILFEDKAKKIAIERFIKEFGKEAVTEVIKNVKD